MRRIQAKSNTTTAIPPRIWEQDQDAWRAWAASLNVDYHTKETYKRAICAFYGACWKSVTSWAEDDFRQYEALLRADGRPENYIKQHVNPVRAYWRFTLRAKAADEFLFQESEVQG